MSGSTQHWLGRGCSNLAAGEVAVLPYSPAARFEQVLPRLVAGWLEQLR